IYRISANPNTFGLIVSMRALIFRRKVVYSAGQLDPCTIPIHSDRRTGGDATGPDPLRHRSAYRRRAHYGASRDGEVDGRARARGPASPAEKSAGLCVWVRSRRGGWKL